MQQAAKIYCYVLSFPRKNPNKAYKWALIVQRIDGIQRLDDLAYKFCQSFNVEQQWCYVYTTITQWYIQPYPQTMYQPPPLSREIQQQKKTKDCLLAKLYIITIFFQWLNALRDVLPLIWQLGYRVTRDLLPILWGNELRGMLDDLQCHAKNTTPIHSAMLKMLFCTNKYMPR